MRAAIKMTLKRVGNKYGVAELKAKLCVWATGRLLWTYCVWTGSAYLESYWFCSDVASARRLLKERIGCAVGAMRHRFATLREACFPGSRVRTARAICAPWRSGCPRRWST